MGVRQLIEHLADDTSENFDNVWREITELRQQLKDDAFALVTLYEALRVLTADPANPHSSAAAARDILGLLNTGE